MRITPAAIAGHLSKNNFLNDVKLFSLSENMLYRNIWELKEHLIQHMFDHCSFVLIVTTLPKRILTMILMLFFLLI